MDKNILNRLGERDFKGDLIKIKERIIKKSNEQLLSEELLKGTYGECIKEFIICGESLVTLNDYLIINRKGIFLININKESGCIYGEEESEVWHFLKRGKPRTFKNPVIQLGETLKEISNFLDNKYKDKLYANIIFTRATSIFYKKTDKVILMKDFKGYLDSLEVKLNQNEVMEIYEELNILNVIDESIREKRRRAKKNYEMNLIHRIEKIEKVDRMKILNEMRIEG